MASNISLLLRYKDTRQAETREIKLPNYFFAYYMIFCLFSFLFYHHRWNHSRDWGTRCGIACLLFICYYSSISTHGHHLRTAKYSTLQKPGLFVPAVVWTRSLIAALPVYFGMIFMVTPLTYKSVIQRTSAIIYVSVARFPPYKPCFEIVGLYRPCTCSCTNCISFVTQIKIMWYISLQPYLNSKNDQLSTMAQERPL